MILPIGDTPNPRNYTPWVSWGIMAVNILVYVCLTLPLSLFSVAADDPRATGWLHRVAPTLPEGVDPTALLRQLSAWDLFVLEHGFVPAAPSVADLFTAMFMHAGVLHLAGNMLFLWIYGDNVEHRLGRRGFLAAYLGTGLVSTLAFSVLAGASNTPLIGASGAISGVLGLYALLFPSNRVKVLVFLFPLLMRTILVPAWLVLGLYLLIDNVVPMLLSSGGSVAYGAHVGGFVAGVVLGWWGERRRWCWPWTGRLPRSTQARTAQADDLARALHRGSRRDAIALLSRTPRRELESLHPDQLVVLADWLEQAGFDAEAEDLLRRGLSRRLAPRHQARIHLALGLARLRAGQGPLAWQHLRRVRHLEPDPATARAAEDALAQLGLRAR